MRYGIGLTGRHCDTCPLLRSTLKVERRDTMGETVITYTCRMRSGCGILDRTERLMGLYGAVLARKRAGGTK